MEVSTVSAYVSALNLNTFPDAKTSKQIRTGDFEKNLIQFGHIQRFMRNARILKYTYAMPKHTATVVSFRAHTKEAHCIHGFLHCHTRQEGSKFVFDPEYICSGPAFTSQDGEFRSKIIRFSQFMRIFEEFPEPVAIVEDLIAEKMNSGELSFTADYYFPKFVDSDQEDLERFVDVQRIPLRLYVICWLYDYYQIYYSAEENHMDKNYRKVFSQKEDIPAFLRVEKMLTRQEYWHLFGSICDYVPDSESMHKFISHLHMPGCGQKIFPLSTREAVRTEDINYVVWREIYMTTLCANLVLNHITPSLPLPITWYYIDNANAKLYDNPNMHTRFEHSEVANAIVNKLESLDAMNYTKGRQDFGPVSAKFQKMSTLVREDINFADSEIRLSDSSVCLILEFVGRTLQDIPKIILAKDLAKDFSYGLNRPFTDYDAFSKTYFEFVYTLYCINSKHQLIHGDLHMNNVTIYQLHNPIIGEKTGTHIKNKSVCYLLRDQAYVFPHVGLFAMIIDFSRGIIGDHKKVEHDFTPTFAEMYFRDQSYRLENMIAMHLPGAIYETHKDTIRSLIATNFALAFKIFTAVDVLTLTRNMLDLFKTERYLEIGVAAGAEDLLTDALNAIVSIINNNLRGVASGQITTVGDIDWPNHTFIIRTFADRVYTHERLAKENISVVDVFNENNPVKYDINTVDYWGPILSAEGNISAETKKKWEEMNTVDGVGDARTGGADVIDDWMLD